MPLSAEKTNTQHSKENENTKPRSALKYCKIRRFSLPQSAYADSSLGSVEPCIGAYLSAVRGAMNRSASRCGARSCEADLQTNKKLGNTLHIAELFIKYVRERSA